MLEVDGTGDGGGDSHCRNVLLDDDSDRRLFGLSSYSAP